MPHLGLGPWIEGTGDDPVLSVGGLTAYNFLTNPPTYSVSGPNNFALGLQLKALKAGSLTQVRLFHDTVMPSGNRTVYVYFPGSTLIRTVAVPGSSSTGWVYASVGAPIAMAINDVFMLALDANTNWVQQTVGTLSGLGGGSAALQLVSGWADFGGPTNFPTSTNDNWFGIDCEYQA